MQQHQLSDISQSNSSNTTKATAPRGRALRTRLFGFGSSTLLAIVASACGAGSDVQGGTSTTNDGSDAAHSTTQALSASTICDAVSSIADVALSGSAFGVSTECGDDNAQSTSYLGSASSANWEQSSSLAEARALYCALQATNGHNAIAQFDTPLGKMGMRSRIQITKADPANLHVTGQRVGQLVAFGHYLDTESQTFDFESPTEWQPAQSVIAKRRDAYPLPAKTYWQSLPAHRGQYSRLNVSGFHFGIHADAEIPIAGPFAGTLYLDFKNGTPYDSGNAFAYAMNPQSSSSGGYSFEKASEDARRDSFHAMQVECKACQTQTGDINTCGAVCPDNTEFEGHFRTCGTSQGFTACNDSYYNNLNDGRLPWEGTYGASGPFVDKGIPNNWWHFGSPKNSELVATVPGEPVFSLLSGDSALSTPTTHLGFGFGVAATVKIFKINFGLDAAFDFRDGLAVRESQRVGDLGSPVTNTVATWIDSESRARLMASAKVSANLPLLGEKTLLDMSYTIMDKSVRSASNAPRYQTSASWTDSEPSGITSYKVDGVETDLGSCLNVPETTRPEIEVNNPKDVANDIIGAAHDSLYPCNIKICDPTTSKFQACTWNSSDNSVSCVDTSESCTCGQTQMDMCVTGSSTVYHGTPRNTTYCDQQAACGSLQACDNDTICKASWDDASCMGGCCQRAPK